MDVNWNEPFAIDCDVPFTNTSELVELGTMFRRSFAAAALVAAVSGLFLQEKSIAGPDNLFVQIKVYRILSPGAYQSYPGVRVRLSNGMSGVTSGTPGMLGVWNVPNLRDGVQYTGQAFVGGRWITGQPEWIGPRFLRIHVIL